MKKRLLLLSLSITTMLLLCSCTMNKTSNAEKQYTEQLQQQANTMVGYPQITNFYEKAQLKELYELRDDPNLVCHWYTKNNMSGKFIYMGKCIGYGIPFGASITSPDVGEYYSNGGTTVTSQAEPNGLYTNNVTSSATWVLDCSTEEIKPQYVEQEVMISQTKLDKRLVEDWSLTEDY